MFVSTFLTSDAHGTYEHHLTSKELEQRMLWLDSQVDSESMNHLIRQYNHLITADDKAPIKLFITSDGGSIDDGMALYDAITSSPAPVYTCAVARAYSMGAILLLAGSKRYALAHSKIMIHQARIINPRGGTLNELEDNVKTLKAYDELMFSILSARAEKSLADIKEATNYDHYFTAQKAKDYGLIDDIITLNDFLKLN